MSRMSFPSEILKTGEEFDGLTLAFCAAMRF